MRARSRKILSLLLAASMVFAMNSFAFASEAAETAEPAFEPQEIEIYTGFNENMTVVNYAPNKKQTATDLAVITNVADPKTWISSNNVDELVSSILWGRHMDDEHLANQQKVAVSGDRLGYYYDTLSCNILPVDEAGHYLILGYYCEDGHSYGYVEGFEKPLPIYQYDGRAVYWHKKNKSSKSKVAALQVAASVVSYNAAAGTVTELEGITVKSVKVKNNKVASVSGEAVENPETHEYVYKLLNGAKLPTFTVKVAAKDDAKPFKKAITKTLKTMTFQFAIRQAVIYLSGGAWDTFDYNLYPELIVSPDKVKEDEKNFVGRDGFGSLWVNDDGNFITAAKVKGAKAALTFSGEAWTGKKYKPYVIKMKPKKDYTLTTKTVGGETVTVMDQALGNYMFSAQQDLTSEGFLPAFRTYGVKKAAQTRYGVYKADTNAFVFNED